MERRMYFFKGDLYSAKEIDEIIYNDKKNGLQIALIINQRTLAYLLNSGGMPRLAKKIGIIADTNEKRLGEIYSSKLEREQIKNSKRYYKKIRKFQNSKFSIDTHSCYQLLWRNSFGPEIPYSYIPNGAKTHYRFIDIWSLTNKQEICEAVAQNFKRATKGQEMITYENKTKSR